jgi:hypothetical protein
VLVDKLAHAEAEAFRLVGQLELRRLLEEQSRVSVIRGAVLGMRRDVGETSRERVERERGRSSGEGNVWTVCAVSQIPVRVKSQIGKRRKVGPTRASARR